MIYADAETRECWRINYGTMKLEDARGAFDYWERHGGPPSGCVLALAHAIEQIDADEELLRQALDALDKAQHVMQSDMGQEVIDEAIAALRERLK